MSVWPWKVKRVYTCEETDFYLGTCCTCICNAKNRCPEWHLEGYHKDIMYNGVVKCSWNAGKPETSGVKVTPAHNDNGMICAKFSSNLPNKAIEHRIRAMLYPLQA